MNGVDRPINENVVKYLLQTRIWPSQEGMRFENRILMNDAVYPDYLEGVSVKSESFSNPRKRSLRVMNHHINQYPVPQDNLPRSISLMDTSLAGGSLSAFSR